MLLLNFGILEAVTVVLDGPSRTSPFTAGNAEIPPSLSISYTSSQYLPASTVFTLHVWNIGKSLAEAVEFRCWAMQYVISFSILVRKTKQPMAREPSLKMHVTWVLLVFMAITLCVPEMQNEISNCHCFAIWALTNWSAEFDISVAVVSNNGEIKVLI